jgi:IS605 OrfB family transposase
MGVDLGIVNIATTSDGDVVAGRRLNRYRARQVRLRAELQKKGTKSAKRLLKKRARRERRFAADVNHGVSKSIVAEAERTSRGIALENLQGIRARARLTRPQRAAVHSWAFAQLGAFIGYKARRAGVPHQPAVLRVRLQRPSEPDLAGPVPVQVVRRRCAR